jgi:ribosomal protein S18 acetylase RimI-like enzyme
MADAVVAPCRPEDLPAIVDLVNAAYRGTAGPVGWTSEVGYIDGTRTSLDDLKRDLAADTDPVLLTLRQAPDGEIAACALIERCHARDGAAAAYIGMVTVRPDLQAGGVGRTMLQAAEDFARRRGAVRARMTVVSIRHSLIAWYERRGYRLTGEREAFPYHEQRFGVPRGPGLEFVVLEKKLAPSV